MFYRMQRPAKPNGGALAHRRRKRRDRGQTSQGSSRSPHMAIFTRHTCDIAAPQPGVDMQKRRPGTALLQMFIAAAASVFVSSVTSGIDTMDIIATWYGNVPTFACCPECQWQTQRFLLACAVCRVAEAMQVYERCTARIVTILIWMLQLTMPICIMGNMTSALKRHRHSDAICALLLTVELACHIYSLQHLSRCSHTALLYPVQLPPPLRDVSQTRQRAMLLQGRAHTAVYVAELRPLQ